MAPVAPLPALYKQEARARRIALIAESYARLLGRALVSSHGNISEALWNLPAVIVAHGTEPDPIFFFGNACALSAFECDAGTFTEMPSRLSAEAPLRQERQDLLDRVTANGFIDDYSGIRISATGRRFRVEKAVVWNLIDDQGLCHGQAATFTL